MHRTKDTYKKDCVSGTVHAALEAPNAPNEARGELELELREKQQ